MAGIRFVCRQAGRPRGHLARSCCDAVRWLPALLPIFARDILHISAWGFGLLRSAPALGALVVAVVLTRWPVTRRAGRVMISAVARLRRRHHGLRGLDHAALSIVR